MPPLYNDMRRTLFYTKSVCPHCLSEIPAEIVEEDGEIYMRKTCPWHGSFETVIWQDDAAGYERWLNAGGVRFEDYPDSMEKVETFLDGLNFKSAACSQSCSSALMTTSCCNMDCPVCFTRIDSEHDRYPTVAELKSMIEYYYGQSGENAVLELCGGEPTTREDLCEIASFARSRGFDYIQVNTNGIKMAADQDFCNRLREAGITTAYLGFDGMTEKPYLAKYGQPMLDIKKKAVENCEKSGIAVVLVVCVIPGENDAEIGSIIRYAKEHIPTVKGVYYQPISYFGTYDPDSMKRITIPKVLRLIEMQTYGELPVSCFSPGSYEHPQCAFNGNLILNKYGTLIPMTRFHNRERNPDEFIKIRKAVRNTWMPSRNNTLTVSGMGFQDAWNIDLYRISRCSVQIIGKNHMMMPLCSKYLTDEMNNRMNPGID